MTLSEEKSFRYFVTALSRPSSIFVPCTSGNRVWAPTNSTLAVDSYQHTFSMSLHMATCLIASARW